MVWYSLLYYIVAVFVCDTAVKAFLHKSEIGNRIGRVQIAAIAVILFHTVGFWTDSYRLVSLSNSCYAISVDVLLLTVLQFLVHHIEGKAEKKINRIMFRILYFLMGMDSLLMIVNVFKEIAMTYQPLFVSDGRMRYEMVSYKPFYLHLFVCYFLIARIIFALVKKMIDIPKLYRSRYSSSLVAVISIVALNYMVQTGVVTSRYGNVSLLLYGFGCPLLYWSSFDYSSKGMLNTIRKTILEYMDTPMILFDYEGYLADTNRDMIKLFPVLENSNAKIGLIDFIQLGAFRELQSTDTDQVFEWYHPNDNGEKVYQCNFNCLKDEKGRSIGHLITLKSMEVERDPLTKLYSRQSFRQKLRMLELEKIYPVTLIVCNANSIGLINDVFGWNKGNDMLRMLAELLRENLPKSAFLARLDDGDMAAVFTEVEQEYAEKLFENIRMLYKEANDTGIDADLEYGIAVVRNSEKTMEQAYREAVDSMRTKKLLNETSQKSSLMDSLTQTLTESDYETEEHVERTKEMAMRLGRALHLSDADLGKLALLAVLHDIGKIAIPHSILAKPGKLTKEEWEVMKTHTEKGYRIASVSQELNSIADYILHHHERWDGNGYPSGLKGEEIPLLSRIITVVDSHDVMIHDRPYHRAMSEEAAREELIRCSGTQFDPHIVTVFLEMLKEEKDSRIEEKQG